MVQTFGSRPRRASRPVRGRRARPGVRGLSPAVIYGAKQDATLVALDPRDVMKELHKGGWQSHLYEVAVKDGPTERTLMRDVQFHPVTDRPSMWTSSASPPARASASRCRCSFLHEDTSPGLKAGGVLNVVRREIEVLADPENVPEAFEIDLAEATSAPPALVGGEGHFGAKPVIQGRDFMVASSPRRRSSRKRPRPRRGPVEATKQKAPGRRCRAGEEEEVRAGEGTSPEPPPFFAFWFQRRLRGVQGGEVPFSPPVFHGRATTRPLLWVGLGNPGPNTRASGTISASWRSTRSRAAIASPPGASASRARSRRQHRRPQGLGAEALTYMNASGDSVQQAAAFLKIPVSTIWAFHDELDLAPGKVRVKKGGGVAGHNGLRDMRRAFASAEFWRVRLGIGHPGHKDAVTGHVLGNFAKAGPGLGSRGCSTRWPIAAPLLAEGKAEDFMTRVALLTQEA
jgi:large subunit ribosomal protein L25